MKCKKSGSCCGGGSKIRSRYAMLTIERTPDESYILVDNTPSTSNIMQLTKKNKNNLWAGSVFSMGLHKDKDFMDQVKGCDNLMGDSCEVIE